MGQASFATAGYRRVECRLLNSIGDAHCEGAEQIDEPVREYVQRVASFIDGV